MPRATQVRQVWAQLELQVLLVAPVQQVEILKFWEVTEIPVHCSVLRLHRIQMSEIFMQQAVVYTYGVLLVVGSS